MMIDTVTGWSEIAQYNNKIAMSISNLIETTWVSRYPRPTEIMYDQGSEFIGHEFRKFLIEIKYRITAKRTTLGIPTSNVTLEQI